MDRVRVILGDTDNTPYGGGTWASRGAGIGGEAALQAAKALRKNILDVAAAILQSKPAELDIVRGSIVNASDGTPRIELSELARIAYFRPDTLPPGIQPELMATRHHVPRQYPFAFTNGVQASWLEVDAETGFVKLLKHWVVEDCGTIINPQLVDEQIRGGVVQGLGAALFEKCIYDERGQLTNANMADYLVPMSGEMPDIDVGHVVSPTLESELGAKGAGEAGTAGAAAAVANAQFQGEGQNLKLNIGVQSFDPRCLDSVGREHGVHVVPIYSISDNPAMTILDLSATLGIDILILGASHRQTLASLLKGNVVTEVASGLPENIQLVIHG